MALITLDEAKIYLRVDSSDDDELISSLLASAKFLCGDVARLTDEQLAIVFDGGEDTSGIYTEQELAHVQEVIKVAIYYALGYTYEHREDADHHELTMTLRSILFAIREGVY